MIFLDSSALVKRYADEEGAGQVRENTEPAVASQLARVEVPAALWRKYRMGELAARDVQVLTGDFNRDCLSGAPVSLVAVNVEILDLGQRLIARHPLRAYDAVQLASAMVVRSAAGVCTFGSFDHRLNDVAVAEGFALAFHQ